ncbi:hypothetical protein GCM10023216_05840 [Isoptericola chiayiensis]|uniref:IclR family transcriptional regulator n=1 Tax=Isoptericola chiayiensis TaxID=579446 RepID=A0ABP8Y4G5_9MICO
MTDATVDAAGSAQRATPAAAQSITEIRRILLCVRTVSQTGARQTSLAEAT